MPPPDADWQTLRAHYRRMNARIAQTPYDDAIFMCQSCGAQDSNVTGKSPHSGRNLYCSDACQALRKRYDQLRPQPHLLDTAPAAAAPPLKRRRRRVPIVKGA